MAAKFEAEIQQLDQLTYVRLAGPIDEDNDLIPLINRIRGKLAVIDFSAVHDINNCGVRDWVRWREEVQARGAALVLVECSPAVVAKLNSVSNFNEGGFIKSFYVPFFCQACEMEKAILVELDELRGDGPVVPPTCRCDACDGIMAFDDMTDSYFTFVKEARKVSPPEEVQEQLKKIIPSGGERKILSGSAWSGSSFANIPSSSSLSDFGTGSGSASAPSVSSLRRLRDKTGLRTLRRLSAGSGGSQSLSLRKGILYALVLALGLILILVLAIFFH